MFLHLKMCSSDESKESNVDIYSLITQLGGAEITQPDMICVMNYLRPLPLF